MNWFSKLFSRHARNIHFAAIVFISLVLILKTPQINQFVSDVILATFNYPFFKIHSSCTNLTSVASDRDRLQVLLVEMSVRLSQCGETARENERLRAALGFEPSPEYRLTPAKVIQVSGFGNHLPITATINKGTNDSVFFDLPIINQDGLIGRVASASDHFASIQLLTDPSHRVAARIAGSREMGIVRFVAQRGMVLDNFPIQGTIGVGDTVITSGLGGVYPSGLTIGTVAEVTRPGDKPFCDVKLHPAANFRSLEEVFVLRPEQK
jgi:rod shape-determining protein MreC